MGQSVIVSSLPPSLSSLFSWGLAGHWGQAVMAAHPISSGSSNIDRLPSSGACARHFLQMHWIWPELLQANSVAEIFVSLGVYLLCFVFVYLVRSIFQRPAVSRSRLLFLAWFLKVFELKCLTQIYYGGRDCWVRQWASCYWTTICPGPNGSYF